MTACVFAVFKSKGGAEYLDSASGMFAFAASVSYQKVSINDNILVSPTINR